MVYGAYIQAQTFPNNKSIGNNNIYAVWLIPNLLISICSIIYLLSQKLWILNFVRVCVCVFKCRIASTHIHTFIHTSYYVSATLSVLLSMVCSKEMKKKRIEETSNWKMICIDRGHTEKRIQKSEKRKILYFFSRFEKW